MKFGYDFGEKCTENKGKVVNSWSTGDEVSNMARNKTKDSDAVSFRIRKDISERLNDYSESSHIPKTAIVEMALEE